MIESHPIIYFCYILYLGGILVLSGKQSAAFYLGLLRLALHMSEPNAMPLNARHIAKELTRCIRATLIEQLVPGQPPCFYPH